MADTSSSRSSPKPIDRRLAVARVLGAKGLAGAVRVELLTDWPERLAPGAEVWLEGSDRPLRIARIESGGRATVLHFEGVTTREAAAALTDHHLEAPPQPLPADTYYWDELIGLRVEEPDGTAAGEVLEVFRAGGNEVYRVVGPRGERLVPALRTVVLRVDLAAGVMVVAPDNFDEVG